MGLHGRRAKKKGAVNKVSWCRNQSRGVTIHMDAKSKFFNAHSSTSNKRRRSSQVVALTEWKPMMGVTTIRELKSSKDTKKTIPL